MVVAKAVSPKAAAATRPVNKVGPADLILDIGPRTAELYARLIARAGTIIWNGPVGVFEIDRFGRGTKRLAQAVAKSKAFSVAGGGDTLAALEKYGLTDQISYVSTGGGAFLEFLDGTVLPAVAVLAARAKPARPLPGVRAPASELLTRLFRAGLDAADPAHCLPRFLPAARPAGRTVVLGAGKAAAAMAAAVAAHHAARGLGPLSGAVVTRYGHGLRPGEEAPGIEVLEAGHPVPDAASVAAGARILAGGAQLCSRTTAASSCSPAARRRCWSSRQPASALADKQEITRRLLASGAAIAEINTVRRKLSAHQGRRAGPADPGRRDPVAGDLGRARRRAGRHRLRAAVAGPGVPGRRAGHPRPLRDRAATRGRPRARRAGSAGAVPPLSPRHRPRRGQLRHGGRGGRARRRSGRLASPGAAAPRTGRPGTPPGPMRRSSGSCGRAASGRR